MKRPPFIIHKIDGDDVLVAPTTEQNSRGRFEFRIWRINVDCPPNLRDQFGMTFISTGFRNHYDYVAEVYRKYNHPVS